jgi:hypothetical protein
MDHCAAHVQRVAGRLGIYESRELGVGVDEKIHPLKSITDQGHLRVIA